MKLAGGCLTVILGVVVFLFLLGKATTQFHLITVHPAFWPIVIASALLVVGGLLAQAEVPGGSLLLSGGVIMMLMGIYQIVWPKSHEASSRVQKVADTAGAEALNKIADLQETPKEVPCTPPLFAGPTAQKPNYHYLLVDDQVTCYTWTGRNPNEVARHPDTQEFLLPLTKGMAERILKQQTRNSPPATPEATPRPEPIIIQAPNQRPISIR